MEMHQVRYFLAVCEAMSFTRAAAQCNVSQPALTTAIKKLEDEVGGPLFHRDGKRLLLTELGKLLRPYLGQVNGQLEAARAAADNFQRLNQVPLAVGVLATIGPMRLAQFLARFRREHPGIELALHEGKLAELVQRLDAGELDLALVSGSEAPDGDLRIEPLYRERYLVVFPPGHRFERMNAITLAEVSGEPYVDRLSCEMRDLVLETCAARDVRLYAVFRSEREDWIQGMVTAGIGFAFLPEYSVTLAGLLSRPLIDPPVERTVALARRTGRQLSPAAAAFRRAAQAYPWPG